MSGVRRSLPACLLLALVFVLSAGGPAAAYRRAVFPVQSLGNSGVDVVALQHLLRGRGQQVAANAVFGRETQAAVAGFQKQAGLAATGVADPATWRELVPQLAPGSTGEPVMALQKLLNRKRGAGLTVNGEFGAATAQAVRTLQGHMRLSVTSIVNTATWRNLLWHYARPTFALSGLCNYNGGHTTADWGTGSTVGMLETAASLFHATAGTQIAVGDISFEHGGDISLHSTHEVGLDVDIALVRRDRRQCRRPGISYKSTQYDRAATRQLIRAIYEAAPRHVKLIYFNDPVLVREGIVQRYPRHADHIHVRYCEARHRLTRYRCPAASFHSASVEAPELPQSPPPVEPSTEPRMGLERV